VVGCHAAAAFGDGVLSLSIAVHLDADLTRAIKWWQHRDKAFLLHKKGRRVRRRQPHTTAAREIAVKAVASVLVGKLPGVARDTAGIAVHTNIFERRLLAGSALCNDARQRHTSQDIAGPIDEAGRRRCGSRRTGVISSANCGRIFKNTEVVADNYFDEIRLLKSLMVAEVEIDNAGRNR